VQQEDIIQIQSQEEKEELNFNAIKTLRNLNTIKSQNFAA